MNSMEIGIFGESIGHTYFEVNHRPLYVVQESINRNRPTNTMQA